jgi:large subunit ribosomal protein L24
MRNIIFRKHFVRVGDFIKVLSGDDKGRIGEVLDFNRIKGEVKVKGINLQTHFTKKSERGPGSIRVMEGWISVSKVCLISTNLQPIKVKVVNGERVVKGGYTILSRRPNYKKLIEGGDNE